MKKHSVTESVKGLYVPSNVKKVIYSKLIKISGWFKENSWSHIFLFLFLVFLLWLLMSHISISRNVACLQAHLRSRS